MFNDIEGIHFPEFREQYSRNESWQGELPRPLGEDEDDFLSSWDGELPPSQNLITQSLWQGELPLSRN